MDCEKLEISSFRDQPIHEAVAPIIWLHGKWRTEDGIGTWPNLPSFSYGEELQFSSVGQSGLNYSAFSWCKSKKIPLHQETGFLRIQAGTNNLAFMTAHNSGIAVIEEGDLGAEEAKAIISLKSSGVIRMGFSRGPAVLSTKREFRLLSDNVLEQVLYMSTADAPSLLQHLTAIYQKID